MIITNSTTDQFYLEQLLAFLSSIRENSPDESVWVDLVNTDTDIVNRLGKVFPNYNFSAVDLDTTDNRGYYLIIHRVRQLITMFSVFEEAVTWLDTDTIVRDDLSWFTKPKPNELRILKRDYSRKIKFDAPINAGVFSIGFSPATWSFANDWYENCKANPIWGAGQPALWTAYRKHRNKIKLTNIKSKYNDLGGSDRPEAFASNSVIWHCKKKHFEHPKFQKEFQYYLGLVKGSYYA
jgi:hypothetical protein